VRTAAFGTIVEAPTVRGGWPMSTTTLTRSDQTLAKPTIRTPWQEWAADAPEPPRRRRFGRKSGARPVRSDARALDVHARSVAMWPRAYR